MNAIFLPSQIGRFDAADDAEALALMLGYIVGEAERLGLRLCAHHAEAARDALSTELPSPGGLTS